MSSKWNLLLTGITALLGLGYVLERKRACQHHARRACMLEAKYTGQTPEQCTTQAKKECRLFGIF